MLKNTALESLWVEYKSATYYLESADEAAAEAAQRVIEERAMRQRASQQQQPRVQLCLSSRRCSSNLLLNTMLYCLGRCYRRRMRSAGPWRWRYRWVQGLVLKATGPPPLPPPPQLLLSVVAVLVVLVGHRQGPNRWHQGSKAEQVQVTDQHRFIKYV